MNTEAKYKKKTKEKRNLTWCWWKRVYQSGRYE